MVDGKQPSSKTNLKVLYDSAVQKLVDEVGLSLLQLEVASDAANKQSGELLLLVVLATGLCGANRPPGPFKGVVCRFGLFHR